MKNMRRKFINILSVLLLGLLGGCGSSTVKIAKNPQPLGVVPFVTDNVAGNAQELNRDLREALEGSGRFVVVPMDTVPGVWDEQRIKALPSGDVKWILTGKFELEAQTTGRGTYFPFIMFKPYVAIRVQAQYRLYNREKNNWAEIGRVDATAKRVNDLQFFEVDPSDPDLQLDARDRQLLREKAYRELFARLVEKVSSKMKIK